MRVLSHKCPFFQVKIMTKSMSSHYLCLPLYAIPKRIEKCRLKQRLFQKDLLNKKKKGFLWLFSPPNLLYPNPLKPFEKQSSPRKKTALEQRDSSESFIMVNLFLFDGKDVVDGHVIITDSDKVQHIHKVLKCEVGSTIKMGQLEGPLYTGHVVEMTDASVRVRLELVAGSDFDRTRQSAGVCILLGTPRPSMIKSISVVTATMGVDHILCVRSERVDKSYLMSKMLRPDELRKNLIHGAEQGVVRQLPVVTAFPDPSLEVLLRDIWPKWEQRLCQEHPTRTLVKLIAEPRMEHNLIQATSMFMRAGAIGLENNNNNNETAAFKPMFVLAVGPEGGWVAAEVEIFKAAGFIPFNMGDKILRTETAVVALLSQVALVQASLPWILGAVCAVAPGDTIAKRPKLDE